MSGGLQIAALLSLFLSLLTRSTPVVFKDLEYADLNSKTYALDGPYGIISDAKNLYEIGEVEQNGVKCTSVIARVTDRATLNNDVQRPQVIISGEIHGDERVVRVI